jgi:hypothetical protein
VAAQDEMCMKESKPNRIVSSARIDNILFVSDPFAAPIPRREGLETEDKTQQDGLLAQ